ncbi:MAG: DNA mismatch repair protein MutS [Treponema sp.]|nr:DNA mismatch repair protein MutS [Treponema sp.]
MKEEVTLTPVMQQYMSLKSQHKNEVVFFRLGDFYEMFFDDAVEVSRLLNLTLTHRGTSPMCGIPFHAAKIYIARLLRLGKKIVICEQVGDPKAKGLTERKVVETITPGTALDAEYLEGNSNNFLAAMCISHGMASYAFIDVTTASFSATSWHAAEMEENFPKELGRSSPRELLLPQSLCNNEVIKASINMYPDMAVSYYPDWDFNPELSYRLLTSQFKTINLKSFNLEEDSPEIIPAGFLLDYLNKTTNSVVPHVKSINIYKDFQYLILDDSSRRNLEVVSNLRDGSNQFTLFDCVNYARTAMGNRKIRKSLLFPLTNLEKIKERQSHIEYFYCHRDILKNVAEKLSSILDIERLAGRIAMDRAHAKDLKALQNSLSSALLIRNLITDYNFNFEDEERAVQIIDLIASSIDDDPATSLTDGRLIKSGWSEELDHWRKVHDDFDQILSEYESSERAKTGIPTLKIKYTNASGYFIEVSRGKLDKVPEDFIMRRSLVNGDRFTTARLQELEHELSEAGSKILELERDLFIEVRNRLHEQVSYLMSLAEEIAAIDFSASFAQAAIVNNWVKPELSDSLIFDIQNGRHPVVEKHLPAGEFVPNSLNISSQDDESICFALITGPNMAGKSTYLRQNALIALLAQTGSFVPASSAKIGLVDRIFCRVGASDNLARGESTFLVEMTETANILRSASRKSLVIMDEVGRGTSTEDGLSIAWAVSEYLLDKLKCRTLFATHYHELTRIENPRLKLLCMDVLQQGESVTFLRKIKEGASENSYGIHVAKLAGIPDSVITRAKSILEHLQKLASDSEGEFIIPEKKEESSSKEFNSPGLFCDEEIILDEILSVDPDNLTPMEALKMLSRWKKTLSGK